MNTRSTLFVLYPTVARFAQEFIKDNGHPDGFFLEGLREDDARNQRVGDKVWWEHKDGRRGRCPDYQEIQ